jgi:glutaminase
VFCSSYFTCPLVILCLLYQAITRTLAVPDWQRFTDSVESIYDDIAASVHGGANASYIPILEEADPNWFGVSVCTVDGQRLDIGDCDIDCSIQSCVKPLMYAVAIEDVGLERVHKHVGIEPSGLAVNEISLNSDGLPHNPMVNAGSIATGSCVLPGADMSSRFKHFMDKLEELAGGAGKVGFSQPTYLCELETSWRNNALKYFMQEAGVFSPETNPDAALDFYLQCCSVEVNTAAAAGIAATLANGGTSPLTGVECVAASTVKSVLTLMFSCGMYDYSGEWCVHVGLPAKSGAAGLMYIVIPHVMGIAISRRPLMCTATP